MIYLPELRFLMRIAVVSDTHDNQNAAREIVKLIGERGIDTVIHLGDIVSPFTLRLFSGFNYYGVFGNNDGERLLLKKIADEHGMHIEEQPFTFELCGKKFLIYHGSGSVEKTRGIVESFAESDAYDFVLYGHTHIIDVRRIDRTLILNPGEACGYLSGKRSFAVLDTANGNVDIVEF